MAMLQEPSDDTAEADVFLDDEERRRFQRVRVNLLGRYMLADRREFPCQVVEMSPGDMALIAPQIARDGRTRHRLYRPSRPARRHHRRARSTTASRSRFRLDRAKARQARRRSSPGSPTAKSSTCRKTAATAVSCQATRPRRSSCRTASISTCRIIDASQSRRRHRLDRTAGAWACWSASASCRAAWSATSTMASPSSSPGCSIWTFSKRTSPASKRHRANFARDSRAREGPVCVSAASPARRLRCTGNARRHRSFGKIAQSLNALERVNRSNFS